MAKIRIIKTIARVEINRRIGRGQKFIDQLKDPGLIDTQEKFLEIQKNHDAWSASNAHLLRRIFDDDSIAAEYKSLNTDAADEERSLFENETALREAVERRVNWLRNIEKRLDEFPQSELTPRRLAGINEGEIWVSEDFDEPLPEGFGTGAL